jgi:hypothetical protein
MYSKKIFEIKYTHILQKMKVVLIIKGMNEILKKIVRIIKNPFLILSISLFLFLILISLILVINVYKSEQKEGYIEDMFLPMDNNQLGVHQSWKIFSDTFVSGDFIRFRYEPFDRNISDNNSLDDYGLSINYATLPTKDFYNRPFPYKTICNVSFIPLAIEHSIYIEGPGTYFITFEASLTNINTGEVIKTIPSLLYFRYRSISQEEDRRRPYEKLLMIFALISLSLAISFTSVKNLMEIWDRKIK